MLSPTVLEKLDRIIDPTPELLAAVRQYAAAVNEFVQNLYLAADDPPDPLAAAAFDAEELVDNLDQLAQHLEIR